MATTTKRLKCPKCGDVVWKVGLRLQNRRGDVKQQYRCRSCRFTTVNPVRESRA